MTQRANQSTIVRAGENPYLERVMRLIGIGVSMAVTIFALAGVSGIVSSANSTLETEQNSGLSRMESAIQAKLDRYTTDLTSLSNDPNLIEHLTGAENVRIASTRASEIIALHLNEYERIQFIEIRNGQPFLAFDRVNNNNVVSDVTPYANSPYSAVEQATEAFTSVLNGTNQSIVFSDFYVQTDDAGRNNANNTVVLDGYIPVYIDAELAMIIKLQINATELRNIVNLAVGELVEGDGNATSRRVLWLVNADSIIADSDSVGTNYVENLNASQGNIDGNEFYEAILDVRGLLAGTDEPIQNFSQNTIYSAKVIEYDSLPALNWRIIITDTLSVYHTSTIVGVIAVAIFAFLTSVIVVVVIKQILRPVLQQVYEADTLIQTSAQESNIAVRSVGDQAELVAAARRVTTRLNRLNDDLENETKRRNRDMQVAGRIGRETATLTDLDTLANTTINLICNELGFYHAQIFLLDQSRTNAVLRYSRGDAGKELISRGHQLRVGSDSVIGTVTAEKRPVIVNDTQANRDEHAVNPLLNETRAEMGLPLVIGDTIIGSLDVQSRQPYSFLDDDIPTYQLLADQLAVGIYNTQLREQTEQRISQIDTLNRQLTREAWHEVEDKLALRQDYGAKNIDKAQLSTSISIRGEVIGSFEANLPEGQQFSDADRQILRSVAERVSLALENARLFQETQASLSETQFERQRLNEILQTLPVGVMVLDFETLEPTSINDQVAQLLGQDIRFDAPFTAQTYNIYRTGTDLFYPDSELPIVKARNTGQEVDPIDDLAVVHALGYTDLLMSAAPIFDTDGQARAIVAAFQDISTLRSMENTIQENLRETILLYETQRTLNDALNIEELLDGLVMQLAMQQTSDAFVLLNQDNGRVTVARSLVHTIDNPDTLKPILRGNTVNIDDIEHEADLEGTLRQQLLDMNMRSILVMPLHVRTRQEPLGWLMMVEDAPDKFGFDQERLMTSIADMTSQAINNNYLFESTQSALQATESLYNANTAISSARGNEALFNEIEKLLDVLQPDMRAGYLIAGRWVEPMFKLGFEDSNDVFDLDKLMTLELPPQAGLYVADITRNTLSPFELEVINAGNISAFATININVDDVPRGRLFVGYKERRHFDTSDERYMRAIADSASVVIDNQLLLSQVQDTLRETSVLYQASKALIETNNPNDIVEVITSYLIAPHVNQVFIAMLNRPQWDSPSAAVEIVASWQSGAEINLNGVVLSPDEFPAWSILATDRTFAISDIQDERNNLEMMEQMSIESLNIRSLAVLPLRVTGRAIGSIWLASDEAHKYTDRDIRIFQSFAEQTSLSLEAKRLLEQTEERARQLQTSAVISQSVGQILDLDILLPQVVELIRDQFAYDHVQIFLMDEDKNWALLTASTGEAGAELLGIGHKLQRGSASVIGQVTEVGQPTIALDTADAEVVHAPNPYLPMTRSEMALPLIVKGDIVGALDVQSNRPNAFAEDDVQVLTTLAAQIAVAIDNARLYEDAEKSAEDMSFLFDITTTAAAAETLSASLHNVAHQIKENVRSDVVAIYLTQDYEDYYGNRKKMIEVNAIASDSNIQLASVASIEVDDTDTTLGSVSANLQPRVIENIGQEIRYSPISGASQSAVIVPITSRDSLVGIITIESNRLNAYTDDTVVLLQTLAGSLTAIIQNTLLVEQLQESNEQLREVDRLKSQFLASMSHELRTPLNSIIGFSRVMLKGIDGALTEMQEQDLTTIYNSGNHLLRLINDILDQAKIEANEINLKFGYFDIKPLVESVKSIAIGLLKEKPNLTLEVEIADGLPKAYGDEFRSRQILLNLVTNAIKFTQEGGVTIRVYAIEYDPAPLLRLDVVDTGMGIAEGDLGTVFEQFRQVDNSLTRTVGGTGLGLPISKSFAELQGGDLTVASEVNVGSTFSVNIPTFEGAEEELDRQREEKRSGQKAVSAQSTTSTGSGLISKSDVEKAKQVAEMNHASDTNGTEEFSMVDTQEFKLQKDKTQRIDTNITQNIPIVTQKRDVILVEDDKTMVDQFRRILQREGFGVTTADFAAFAEAMIGQLRPNVVILDVNFADGAGWNLLKNLKERDDTFDIPVVVTTIDEDSEQAYRLGAHSFIQRPFLPEDVLEAVLKAEKESQRERILIIDDQEDTIRLLTHLLEEHSDFKIYSAQSGDEGISLVARRRPDLIILDLRMPGKDGFAVLDELRGNPETAKIPVLVVTGEMDLNTSEQEQLVDIHILQKTDISQEEYDLFIENVRSYLNGVQ